MSRVIRNDRLGIVLTTQKGSRLEQAWSRGDDETVERMLKVIVDFLDEEEIDDGIHGAAKSPASWG